MLDVNLLREINQHIKYPIFKPIDINVDSKEKKIKLTVRLDRYTLTEGEEKEIRDFLRVNNRLYLEDGKHIEVIVGGYTDIDNNEIIVTMDFWFIESVLQVFENIYIKLGA
ncbi:hypothetical protein [Sulfolobus ellipsoid virus 1]|uniref:Uncharacterized protein n=1 Tax=Sulfolobus ellipsoid virus 1 TaxID=2056194 RepID=A0A2H4RBM2_9VIRU|nr:hypothetical protein FGG62_gp01 [Sulfolobus ellipsoid virus 1]ATY46479.1 hypothetical protein [Sulfolobus ellipsoid virus 1]